MWIIFGLLAISATFINLLLYRKGKNYHLAMVFALSFTSFTLMAEYNLVFTWVKGEDWSALLDTVPRMTIALWILTSLSIVLNSAPAILELRKKQREKSE